jgi:hypothetical protein
LKNAHSFRNAARTVARARFKVFPLRPNSKAPAITGWQEVATKSLKAVDRLWAEHPNANIGIATGGKPGLFVLDVDGDKGRRSLKALRKQYGPLPPTVTVRTPRGDHYYFLCTEPLSNSAGKLGPGLDSKCVGGYVVGAGSVNGDGVRYRYATGHSPDVSRSPKFPTGCFRCRAKTPAAATTPLRTLLPADPEPLRRARRRRCRPKPPACGAHERVRAMIA